MSDESKGEKAPRVFISYSHDTPMHKKWVADLASRLMEKEGVEVILDQWEIGPGDDVPKFMERAISESGCVLMICSEAYVRKADDGKGGVGYEAMIVTGELVNNLGTSKFVPIIRQENGGELLPKSVSTRYYVNLSEGKDFEEGLKDLVHKIHKVPKHKKPLLGKSPFEVEPNAGNPTSGTTNEVKPEDAESAYLSALSVARSNDYSAWRQLVRTVKEPLSGRLIEWRKKFDGVSSMQVADLPATVLEAATIYSPLMAVALAGVESGQEKFTKQTALLDEFVKPKDWNAAGLTVIGCIPEALMFTFQALHGASCLEVGELSVAIRMSRMRVSSAHQMEAVVLHSAHGFVGLPESFGHSFNGGWKYLTSLSDKWPWLNRIFGSSQSYQSAMCAYYMALSIQELAFRIASGKEDDIGRQELILDIPLGWLSMDRDIQQKAYGRILEADGQTREIWRSLGVSDKGMAAAWPKWIEQSIRWRSQGCHVPSYYKPVHATLFEDIRPL